MWERFLPSDYREIISRSVSPSPVVFSSQKDLYFRLCSHPILLDEGNTSFALDKRSGKKCYMVGARQLSIIWGDAPQFSEVAQLLAVCWLEIRGKMETRILSPRINYAVYLVFKFLDSTRMFGRLPAKVYVFVGAGGEGPHIVHLDPDGSLRQEHQNSQKRDADWRQQETKLPRDRGDGWLEIEMGEFFNDQGEDGEVEMSLRGMEGFSWKSGLIIQGIEFRPKEYLNKSMGMAS
ncbi:hypothetical protein HHK36_027047 [Tetracentron sinense]|uniref:Uncharacterized protein n=1 Tax=Tetracentron sinense TaxID=13715 RepID=A0A835D372_TETSI|nr:hypothetical protein HHK36_027047 [Tetracentron sinense]